MSEEAPVESYVSPNPPRPYCRRGFLTLLGLAGASFVASRNQDALSGYWSRFTEFCESLEMPQAGYTVDDPRAGAYAIFLATANLQNITIPLVLRPHGNRHGRVQNTLPPQPLWSNILPTLRIADKLAGEMKEKIVLRSIYRSPEYNATCPGAAKYSQHTRNRAIDFQLQSPPGVVANVARRLRDKGAFRGGIGVYSSFVHIDTRGQNADWIG